MSFIKASLLEDFELPEITHESIKAKLVKIHRGNNIKKSKEKFDDLPISEKLGIIERDVYKVLGKYKGFVNIIRTKDELDKYIDKCLTSCVIAFDTETNNSLDPLTCKLMGVCMYIPNTKPVYIPLNHCNVGTNKLIDNQVSEIDMRDALLRLVDKGVKFIYHNGKFDMRVVYNTLGIYLPIWWDTMLAAQLLDENDKASLKSQYKTYIDPTTDTYKIDKLFKGVPYAWVSPELFAVYAAIDAYDTYKLQQFQDSLLSRHDMSRLRRLFLDIEVPTTEVVCRMEDNGVTIDMEFAKKLNNKYNIALNSVIKGMEDYLVPYSKDIEKQQRLGLLDTPLNFNSTPQLIVLMYDILKINPTEEYGRSTDKNALKALKNDFSKMLLEYRHYSKLINSFTDAIPKLVSKKDGKLHASFNQMGKEENNVRTGRFSSTDPNLQQIPSKEKVIRMIFKGSVDYNIVHSETNSILIKTYDDVLAEHGYVPSNTLSVGDILVGTSDKKYEVHNIIAIDKYTNEFYLTEKTNDGCGN